MQRALAASGLGTRTAVAERIAQIEGRDSPPTGIVNRAFRGERVDAQSLQRIALALDVDAHTLYASSADARTPGYADEQNDTSESASGVAAGDAATPRRAKSLFVPLLIAVTAAGLLALATFFPVLREDPVPPADASVFAKNASKLTIILTGINPTEQAFGEALKTALSEYWTILPSPADRGVGPQQLLTDQPAQQVIELELRPAGRFTGLQIRLHTEGRMRVLWNGAHRNTLAAPISIERAISEIAADQPVVSAQAMARYLSARQHLDRARTELNLRRALTDFDSALRLAPGFADAHAGLCEALVLDSVRTGERTRLDEADSACARALTLAPRSLEGRRAQAYLDRKRGALDAALAALEEIVDQTPGNTDAWLGTAETRLTRFARGADPAEGEAALAAARRAMSLEPNFWKVPFSLARVHYFRGELDRAIEASQLAVAADANMLTLSNLGSFQYCQGDLDGAAAAYERAQTLDAGAFVGDAQLGVVQYFRRDFPRALDHFEVALARYQDEGAAQDHRLWGNYAHTLRQMGRNAEAVAAYGKAIGHAEAAIDAGDKRALHAPYLAYYDEMLAALNGDDSRRWPEQRLLSLHATQDPIALLYLAVIHGLRGDAETARPLLARGTEGCPGFARAPDLAEIVP